MRICNNFKKFLYILRDVVEHLLSISFSILWTVKGIGALSKLVSRFLWKQDSSRKCSAWKNFSFKSLSFQFLPNGVYGSGWEWVMSLSLVSCSKLNYTTTSQVGETHHSFVHKTVNSDSDLFLNCAAGYLENLFFSFKVHVLYESFWIWKAIYVEIYV